VTRSKLLTLLGQRNVAAVLRALYFEAADSRARIVSVTGIAPSTVSSIVAQLAREGLVEFTTVPQTTPAVGRPPRPIRLNPSALYLVGVEINILQSRVMLVGIDGTIHSRREIDLNARANPTEALTTFVDVTEELVANPDVAPESIMGIGVSFRGLVDREKGLVNRTTSLPEWNHLNIVEPFRKRFSWPVFAENNANAIVLGEARFGMGRGKKNILALIVEEGIGGGIIINGQLYLGHYSAAGELGHMTIIPSGPTCHCGNRGCLRTLASESAIEANAIRIMKSGVASLLNERSEADRLRIRAQDVVGAATQGDAVCHQIILDAARHLGICLVNAANILSPEMIILNESPLTTYTPFLEEIERMLREGVYARGMGLPEITLSSLHENGVCVGAACSVMDRLLGGNHGGY
jgi:predicted NBD/HSP70 family sugar kinase